MTNIEELEKLCEKAMDSIAESNRKLEKESDRLTAEDAKYLDHLAHLVKSVKTVIAMEEYSDDGYSGSRYRRREAMGRYSSDRRDSNIYNGYSRDASRKRMVDKLSSLMDDTMSDNERMAIEDCIRRIN